jgi:agmatinase
VSINRQNQFLGDELAPEENDAASAKFIIVPCGLEKTVSYGTGAAKGPEAIIAASHQLERLVEGREPCLQGMFTQAPIDCSQSMEAIQSELRARAFDIASRGKVPVTLGGEHSLSYGAVMGVVEAASEPIGLVQIDAHADFRVDYQGHKHSHASVMQLLAKEGLPICSFGVRALAQEEQEGRQAHGVICYDGPQLVRQQTHSIELPDDFPRKIYITFDVDGLDPSVLSATGTPVPGGLGFYQSLDLIQSTLKGRECVGMDIVELAPVAGQPVSDFTAALILHHLMAMAV